MDQKLLNKAITLSAKEEKLQAGKPVIKLKDERGLTYTVYKLKKDGAVSVAWEQLAELNLGDTVQIAYVEDLGEYEGKTVTYRTIRSFNRDIGEGMANQSSQPESGNSGANTPSHGQSTDAFGRRLGIQGHINALLSNPQVFSHLAVHMPISEIVKTAIEIEDEAEKQINPSSFRQAVAKSAPSLMEEDLPTIQQEGINVDDIPF